MLATKERWQTLCGKIVPNRTANTNDAINIIYDSRLVPAYSEPLRSYHDLGHISNGLKLLEEIKSFTKDYDALEAAWWFHDYVYRPGNPYNEEESTIEASKLLRQLGVPTPFIVRVMHRIMATKHDHVPTYYDDRLIVDIDLAGLGGSPEDFDNDTAKNREEYRILVPNDKDFQIGRAKFFKRFLEGRPSIYLTAYFQDKYEAQAQENLKRLFQKAGI